jgi:hypothetical protein
VLITLDVVSNAPMLWEKSGVHPWVCVKYAPHHVLVAGSCGSHSCLTLSDD